MTAAEAVRVLTAAAGAVVETKDQLTALDAVAGDGDLGTTLSAGFTAVAHALRDIDQDGDLGVLFDQMGRVMAQTAASTLGTLLSLGYLRAARELAGMRSFDAAALAVALHAMTEEIRLRGGAKLGDRTVVDVLGPAAVAAREAVDRGSSMAEAAAAAAEAADRGADSTRSMQPKHGRAAWLSGRAQGHPDAGAVAAAVWLRAFAVACADEAS